MASNWHGMKQLASNWHGICNGQQLAQYDAMASDWHSMTQWPTIGEA